MKRTIARIIVITLLLMANSSILAVADGPVPQPPFCPRKATCD